MEALGISFGTSPALHLLLTAVLSTLMACSVFKDGSTYPPTPHDITMQQANDLTSRYRTSNPTAAGNVIFTKTAIETVFPPSNTNISGIRYYFGMDNGKMLIIVLGTELNATTHTNDDLLSGQIIVSPNSAPIAADMAALYTGNYRGANPKAVRGGFFSADAIKAVLYDYTDANICKALRFSFGLNANNELTIVVNGLDNTNTDIANGRIIDMSVPCPTDCGKKNIINNYP